MDECKPLTLGTLLTHIGLCHAVDGREGGGRPAAGRSDTLMQAAENLYGRGLRSSTFRLNVSAFCGIGAASIGY